MKRWLLALTVLVGWTVSIAYADFVLIRAVLGGKRGANNSPGGTAGGANPGNPGPGGPPGSPGGPTGPGGRPGPNEPGEIPTFGGGQTGESADTAALAVQAVVPYTLKPSPTGTLVITKYSHQPNGFTRLYNDGQSLLSYKLPLRSNKTVYRARHEAVFKARTSDKVLDLADWALTHGLVDEFGKLMDELVAGKEDQSASASPALKDAVKAYRTVKEALEKPVDREDLTNDWKRRISMRYEQSKHYTLFYNSAISNPPEVQSRLAMLEANMKGVYFWFVMKGIALPIPSDKMVCILLDQPTEFKSYRAILEDEPLVADSFFAQRDNICVFSRERLDGPFTAFIKQTQPIYQSGMDRTALLEGTAKRKATMTIAELARYETLALLEKSLEEEAERAAVSHDGTRQLLVAAGIMPRNVVVPQWAMFGLAAFYETPKGPFPGAPLDASVAFYPGIGAPSWAYLRPFKKMDNEKKFPPEAQLLRQVVTDAQFHRVLNAADREHLLEARTTAWSLAYFLTKTRLPGMMRYCQELSSLPRDLEVNDQALLATFARAFDVANATQDNIDPAKFEELAKNWFAYTKSLTLPGAEFGLQNEPGMGGPGQGMPGGGRPGAPSGPAGPGGGGGRPGGRPGGGGPGGGGNPGG
jgi:hypothetical protein